MAGPSEKQRLPVQSNSSAQLSIRPFGKELQMYPIPQSQMPTTPPSPMDTTATSKVLVGDQSIPAPSAVSGLEDNNDPPQSLTPRRRRQYKVPAGYFLLFGKLHPLIPLSQTPPPPPTGTTATSIGLVADQPIPAAASAVNAPQDTDNPLQSPTPGPNVPVRPRRNGTTSDPNGVGIHENKTTELWESNLWFPGVDIPGRSRIGFQIFLGTFLTKQEAQDAHDRAALKLFETEGVETDLNFDESHHAEFMEEYKDWNFRDFVWQFRRYCVNFTTGTSSMKGVVVRPRAKGNLFEARTAYTYSQEEGKLDYNLGTFKSEEEAGRAYDGALLFLHYEDTEQEKWHVITNFRPSRYSESEILSAGKANNKRIPILPRLLK